MPKKNRRSTKPRGESLAKLQPAHTAGEESFPPAKTTVELPESSDGRRRCDFKLYYGKGCDRIVYACQTALEQMAERSRSSRGQSISANSVHAFYSNGLRSFLPYCAIMATALERELTLKDVDRALIERFIAHVTAGGGKANAKRSKYSHAKSVLVHLARQHLIARDIFPRNPFPRANHSAVGESALSASEMKAVTKALKQDMQRIMSGQGELTSDELAVCLLSIAARTGLNPSPLVQLHVDCIQPHPIKADRYVLVSFKKRGNATHIQSMRYSKDVELIVTALPDVARIVRMVIERNANARAASAYPTSLFVYARRDFAASGITRMSAHALQVHARNFVDQHEVTDADGAPLALNTMRLRKTFANRVFELSGQDPFVTARLGGHTLKVSNDAYLEAPVEAEKNWRLMGEVRTNDRMSFGTDGHIEITPVAGCKDTKRGEMAPKNGSDHCQKFLACFRCKSFVVTADDLHRVFSLYWMLIRERKRVGVNAWSKQYRHIIRIIDRDVAPKFAPDLVSRVRSHAETAPHAFWADPGTLEGAL